MVLLFISWRSFFVGMGTLVLLYYVFVLLIYYRSDIAQLFRNGLRAKPALREMPDEKEDMILSDETGTDPALFPTVQRLTNELKELFYTASYKKYPKEELLMALKSKLKGYQQLKGSAFQVAINNNIVRQSQEYCALLLDDLELKQLW